MDRIEKLKEFLSVNPQDAFINHALALEYIKIGDDVAARKLFQTMLEREPSYVGSYYHLGKLLERSGETAGALECYKKGMEEARKAGDAHSMNELRAAYVELSDDY